MDNLEKTIDLDLVFQCLKKKMGEFVFLMREHDDFKTFTLLFEQR